VGGMGSNEHEGYSESTCKHAESYISSMTLLAQINEALRDSWVETVSFYDEEFNIGDRTILATGVVTYNCYDDSDFNRESGYGAYTHREVDRVDVTEIIDITGGLELDVTHDTTLVKVIDDAMADRAQSRDAERVDEAISRLLEAQDELFPDHEFEGPSAVATVTADFDLFKYPMFKKDQPEIGNFAQSSPENMAKLIIFVICSQQTEWPRFMALFPLFWEFMVRNDRFITVDEMSDPEGLPADLRAGLSWWKGRKPQIEFAWKNRGKLYNTIMRAVDADEKNGDTGFLVYQKMIQVPGLGVPKAGFAVQLLIGKMGCIDSVNLNVLGVNKPSHVMTSKGFKNAKAVQQKGSGGDAISSKEFSVLSKSLPKDGKLLLNFLYGALTKKSYEILRAYADYLADLESKGTSSEVIWNVWCGVIANKIQHFGKKPIDVQLPNQQGMSRLNSYKGSSQSHLNNIQKRLRPWDAGKGASIISRDHVDLIKGIGEALLGKT
jgi:hypothetical protein